jgi:hypothetical protein
MTKKADVTIVPEGVSVTADIGEIKLRQKSAFAVQHLMAAARFSRQCGQVQAENEGKPLGLFFDEQIACVSAAVMLSVASLESNINEYLSEEDKLFPELNQGARQEFSLLISSLAILEKYQKVLSVKGLERFDKGQKPYQDVDILISLRNELVHFHPEWHDEQERHKKLGHKLAYRFELSPFISEESGVLFPQRFVSHGCSKWAVYSSLEFMDAFAEKLGVESKFKSHRNHLNA